MIYTIQNSDLTVSVASKGAELQSIRSRDGTEYLWQGDPAFWSDRALTIFPYVGRLTDGRYSLDGQEYRMRIHGFAMYSEFSLYEQADNRLTLELCDNSETYAQYPRRFRFLVTFQLQGNILLTTYTVENRDTRTMYFGLGGHPGFRVPLTEGHSFEDYRLTFSAPGVPKRLGFSPDCFPDGSEEPFGLLNGTDLPLRHELFDQDAIVLKDMPSSVTLHCPGDRHFVTVSFPQMPYLGIWHWPGKPAPYVCIEPWCSLPSPKGTVAALETQPDLLALEPGQSCVRSWEIEIGTA